MALQQRCASQWAVAPGAALKVGMEWRVSNSVEIPHSKCRDYLSLAKCSCSRLYGDPWTASLRVGVGEVIGRDQVSRR